MLRLAGGTKALPSFRAIIFTFLLAILGVLDVLSRIFYIKSGKELLFGVKTTRSWLKIIIYPMFLEASDKFGCNDKNCYAPQNAQPNR